MSYFKKVGGIIRGGLVVVSLMLAAPEMLWAGNDGQAAYNSFLTLSKNNAVGVVLTEIKFAQDGSVRQCRVVRSNAPYSLEASTIEFIEGHWKNPLFAGEIRFVPITFDQLPSYAKQWNDDMVPPPNPLSATDPVRHLKLRLTFGMDGWITKVEVVDASGVELLDQQTELWVRVHWHHDSYANQVIDAPFQFEPPAPPPAPAPLPVIHKASPPKPEEPLAIPAERVQ